MPFDKAAKILRQAEPDPRRARRDSSVCDNCKSSAALQAPAKAASPLADEARPAAVGNEIAAVDLREKGQLAFARTRSKSGDFLRCSLTLLFVIQEKTVLSIFL